MKRQEIKDLIRRIHPEGDIGDIVDAIMELNGADIENAKKNSGLAKAEEERDTLRKLLDEYEKPEGSKYIDPKEHERLKQFEADTLAAQKQATWFFFCCSLSILKYEFVLSPTRNFNGAFTSQYQFCNRD